MASSKTGSLSAMAFYHERGFVPAYHQASCFAGESGRLATLLDVVDARLATKPGDVPWETWFTTTSAEYLGVSRGGCKIIIVAHGVGPMATLEGILKAYSYQFNDKSRDRRGGRISEQQFWDLESGKYGEVTIVDYEDYIWRYQYPFIQNLDAAEAACDPLLRARFGPRAQEYVDFHASEARKWHAEQASYDPENRYNLAHHEEFCDRRRAQHLRMALPDSDPFIIKVVDASNCSYKHMPLDQGMALAHLLSIARLSHVHHTEEMLGGRRESHESLLCDVSCHEWWDGVRLVGIRGNTPLTGIHPGASDLQQLIARSWQELMRKTRRSSASGFFALMPFAGHHFTQYPKKADGMDTREAEFLVTKMTKVEGGPAIFRTTVGGYHGFFKYGISEVRQLAPLGANAYLLPGEVQIEWNEGNPTHHVTPIEFYHVEVDASQRLIRPSDLRSDFGLLMRLVEIEKTA